MVVMIVTILVAYWLFGNSGDTTVPQVKTPACEWISDIRTDQLDRNILARGDDGWVCLTR